MSRRLIWTLGAVAAVAAGVVWLLPPPAAAPRATDAASRWPTVRGAFHVHSRRSDGTGTVEEIAAAAAAAGLQFVILTDHGDGTRPPDPPRYYAGVLCLNGVEISTDEGHYIALGAGASPYPLAGRAAAVIEDVRRLGGLGIVAHPGSEKPALRWQDWDAPFDGLEWLNADSEWRDEFLGSLGRVLLTYPLRPVETLGALLDRPTPVLAQWQALTRARRVPAVAAADAHARLGWRAATDPYEDRVIARVPGYAVSFRAFANHVILDRALTGEAEADAAQVLNALAEGRVFTSLDALAGLSLFEMHAGSGPQSARPGEYLDLEGPAAIEARIAAPPGTTLAVLQDGEVVYDTREPALRLDIGSTPGAYRVEAYLPGQLPGRSVPWVFSNPVYVGMRGAHRAAAAGPTVAAAGERTPVATPDWRAEASDGSSSALRVSTLDDGTPALEWSFALAEGAPRGQYAAMRFPLDAGLAQHGGLQLRARSDRPRRLWVQLRAPGGASGERWGRTFYVGDSLEPIDLRFDDFRPLGETSSARPPLARIDSLLLVVDTLNTPPGTTGRIQMPDLWLRQN